MKFPRKKVCYFVGVYKLELVLVKYYAPNIYLPLMYLYMISPYGKQAIRLEFNPIFKVTVTLIWPKNTYQILYLTDVSSRSSREWALSALYLQNQLLDSG